MERHLKERLTGATVLVLLGVIFIPMVLDNSSDSTTPARTELQDKTDNEYQSRIIPVAEHPGSDTRTDLATDNGENTAQTARQDVPSTSEPQRNIIQQSASMETDNSTIEATKLASLPEPKIQAANTQGLSGWVVQLGSFSNQTN
ncbi:MAG: hypothetical protein HKN08_01510, partial [Gammaproteobacteria bacterium]|nr:hypothetical protein [Gammaproteobacteria bacterium]